MIDASMFKKVLKGAYANLENNKQMVNNLNVFPVPDGDTGTNMSLTVKTAVEEMSKVTSDKIGDVAASMSSGALMGARGNSGVILSQLFRGFAKGCLLYTSDTYPLCPQRFWRFFCKVYHMID